MDISGMDAPDGPVFMVFFRLGIVSIGLPPVLVILAIIYGRDSVGLRQRLFLLRDRLLMPILTFVYVAASWLSAEVMAQLFPYVTKILEPKLPLILLALFQMAYVTIFSCIVLPALRSTMGVIERYFLPAWNGGEASSSNSRLWRYLTRYLVCINIYADGIMLMYTRIVLAKMSALGFTLMMLKGIASSFYNFGWKYHPVEILIKLTYLSKDGPLPMVRRQPRALKWLRRVFNAGTSLTEDASMLLFSSTFFSIEFQTGEVSFQRRRPQSTDELRVLGSISVINERYFVVHSGEPCNNEFIPLEDTLGAPLSIKQFVEVSMRSLDEQDGHLRKNVIHGIQTAIGTRYWQRSLCRVTSSIVLLLSTVLIAVGVGHYVIYGRQERLHELPFQQLLFPVILVAADLADFAIIQKIQMKWCIDYSEFLRAKRELLRPPLMHRLCQFLVNCVSRSDLQLAQNEIVLGIYYVVTFVRFVRLASVRFVRPCFLCECGSAP